MSSEQHYDIEDLKRLMERLRDLLPAALGLKAKL